MMRITLRSVDDEWDRIRFDLSIDESHKVKREMVYFGFEGSLNNTENSHPLMLNQQGLIDLGDGFEAYSRHHKTNLFEKKIELKQYVTIWWKNGTETIEAVYFVEALTPLE